MNLHHSFQSKLTVFASCLQFCYNCFGRRFFIGFGMNKNAIIACLIFIMSTNFVWAFDLDMTVDDEIRKNYNSSKLVEDTHTGNSEDESLPSLPEISKYDKQNDSVNKVIDNEVLTVTQLPKASIIANTVKIWKGTSFDVVNATKINDWLAKGNTVKFRTKAPIVKRKYTIPAGTTFTGEILEVHRPQITCNGGLVVIRIRSMTYKGQTIPINAYITRADDKKIFLNNIKGDRTYLKTTWKKGSWGRNMFSKMWNLTTNLGDDAATLILSPFPFVYGTVCYGVNTIVSPICAFFSKGGHVSIPAGSDFRIKFLDSVYIE